MELYIGGYGQGKKEYVRTIKKGQDQEIFEDFHIWFRKTLLEGRNAEKLAEEYLSLHPDAVIICDEVGNGIVPADDFERDYRERLGRVLINIAAKSDRVERVICGIGQRIK